VNVLFVLLLLLSTLGWRYAFATRKTIPISFREIAWCVILLYSLTLVTALPLVFIDYWSLALHAAVIACASGFCVSRFLFRIKVGELSFKWKIPRWHGLAFLGAVLLGIGLEAKPIYYLYATHDPSAYLNAALNLVHTGRFSHHQEIVERAFGKGQEDLKPLLNVVEAPEEWMLTKNFGVLPGELSRGEGNYHGLFGSPLFLGIGAALFGEPNCLRMHWVHLFSALVLVIAIVQGFLGVRSLWPIVGAYLWVISPLVVLIFREPLSEPLAEVFFLGLVFTTMKFKGREKTSALVLSSLCLSGAITARISGLMYLPFFFFAMIVAMTKPTRGKRLFRGKPLVELALIPVFGSVALVFRMSPTYVTDILSFYSQVLLKIPLVIPVFVGMAVVTFVALWFFRMKLSLSGVMEWIHQPKIWKPLWLLYGGLVFLGICLRYGRLLLKLDHNFGGVPFVLFNLDSLLFYGGPLIVGVGLGFWFWILYRGQFSRFSFLQGFVPFCFFFYSIYRFMPLNLQVNFQRYLIIELLPLSVIGFVIAGRKWFRRSWVSPALVFTIFWSGGMTLALNRSDIAEGARGSYGKILEQLRTLEGQGEKPVIIAVNPQWLDVAYLMPLSNGFGFPVVFVNYGFSYAESRAISALVASGYFPLMALRRDRVGEPLVEETRAWQPWYRWNACHRYPKFGLGAPPLELAESCIDLNFFRIAYEPRHSDFDSEVQWSLRPSHLPLEVHHWVGFEIDGKRHCPQPMKNWDRNFEVELRFDPEADFSFPRVELNGELVSKVRVLASSSSRRLASHRVMIQIPTVYFTCYGWNDIDIYFKGRRAQLLAYGLISIPEGHNRLAVQ
jgi:hypothetical protein